MERAVVGNTDPGRADYVWIGCKHPPGIVLRYFEWKEELEVGSTSTRTVKMAREVPGSQFPLKSIRDYWFMDKKFRDQFGAKITPGACSITRVSKDLWDNWYSFNKNSDLVRNGLIFEAKSEEDAIAEALARADIRTGLEPIDPENHELTDGLARNPLGNVSGISTAERPS